MPRNKLDRNLDHLVALTKVVRAETHTEYFRWLEYLRRQGWDIRETPRCHDFAAAHEALEGAIQ